MNGLPLNAALSPRPAALWLLLSLLLTAVACRGVMDAVSGPPAPAFTPPALPVAELGRPYTGVMDRQGCLSEGHTIPEEVCCERVD